MHLRESCILRAFPIPILTVFIMAEKDKLDLGEEKKTSSSKKIIFIVLGSVLMTLIAVFATLYFLGVFPPKDKADAAHAGHEAAAQKGEAGTGEHGEETGHEVHMTYHDLEPAFAVNFGNNPEARLLQLNLSLATQDPAVVDALKKHDPMIRNNLLLLIGAEDPAVLKTAEGKEALRLKVMEEINAILKKQAKKKNGIEDVFFTGFIMQ